MWYNYDTHEVEDSNPELLNPETGDCKLYYGHTILIFTLPLYCFQQTILTLPIIHTAYSCVDLEAGALVGCFVDDPSTRYSTSVPPVYQTSMTNSFCIDHCYSKVRSAVYEYSLKKAAHRQRTNVYQSN